MKNFDFVGDHLFLFQLGYNRSEIEESLRTSKFDDCYASYLLLGRKPSDVSQLFLHKTKLLFRVFLNPKTHFMSNNSESLKYGTVFSFVTPPGVNYFLSFKIRAIKIFFLQADSEGSRSGSSLSLRNVTSRLGH